MNNRLNHWRSIGMMALTLALLAGCRDDFPPAPTTPAPSPLRNIIWSLASYQTTNGAVVNVASHQATITFTAPNSMGGYTGCNQFGGEYSADTATSSMTLRNIFATERWCGENSIEPMYMNALQNVTSYKLTATTLHLYATSDTVAILNFTLDSVLVPTPVPTGKNGGIFFNQLFHTGSL